MQPQTTSNPTVISNPTMTDEPEIAVVDHNSSAATTPETMRTSAHYTYGDSSVLEIDNVPVPPVTPRTVLVEVVSAAINPLDWHKMTGTPWLLRMQGGFRKPKQNVLGVDLAGRVVTVGDQVTGFKPGDEVIGITGSCFAQYVAAPADKLVLKPANVTFDEATGSGVAGITAIQGLRDKAGLSVGQHVLINGASGGVGSAAIQLAKWMGAEVTAVCSARNIEMVKSLGADHVVDYTTDDFAKTDQRYDVIFDNQGNRKLGLMKKILVDGGVYVLVGGPKKNRMFGPMGHMLHAIVRFKFSNKSARAFIANERQEDVSELADLMAAGKLRTVIDTTYPLDEVAHAMDQLAAGHVSGKVVINP